MRPDRAAFDRVGEIIERIAPEWAADPNVMEIVPALKTTRGIARPDVLAIGFSVAEKVPPELLADRGYRPIPPEIDGVPTDVIPGRRRPLGSVDTQATRGAMFDTLIGGIAIGNRKMNASGTLAMVLLAVSDGRLVGLTNEHVLVFDGDGKVGDEVQQPRFDLFSEVSLDSAACCPDGQLHYRGVDNAVADAMVAVFSEVAIAAAASDVIDPHRRGQDATVPDPDERTLREVVSIDIDYPEIPFPGRPYPLGVSWRYSRQTDRRTLEHAVTETVRNEHVLELQELVTDRDEYGRGETVRFLAALGGRRCDRLFVTATAVSPSGRQAYKVILRPLATAADEASHGGDTHGAGGGLTWHCTGYARQRPGDSFQGPRVIDRLVYDPAGATAVFLRRGPDGQIALRFPGSGLTVDVRLPAHRVAARVLVQNGDVTLTAYRGAAVVDTATAAPDDAVQELSVAGGGIDRVVLSGGGNESFLVRLCCERRLEGACLYQGEVALQPDEELGDWSTYLLAQTLNDVAVGEDPLVAARTIGGLAVTDNFAGAGESDNVVYGHACNVELVPNGGFRVVESVA